MSYADDLKKGKIERSNLECNKSFIRKSKLFNESCKILEIGCGAGTMTSYLSSFGHDVIGTDVSKELLNYAKKTHQKCTFKFMSGNKIDFPDNSFDRVVSFDVLEHIPDTNMHLSEVYRILKPGGYYLFQTPNKLTNLPYCIVKDKSLTKWKTYHGSLQTKKSLIKKLSKNKFSYSFANINIQNDFFKKKLFFPLTLIDFNKLPIKTNFFVIAKRG